MKITEIEYDWKGVLSKRKKTLYIIYIFALLEGLIYGFGIWWIMYLYAWPMLAIVVVLPTPPFPEVKTIVSPMKVTSC